MRSATRLPLHRSGPFGVRTAAIALLLAATGACAPDATAPELEPPTDSVYSKRKVRQPPPPSPTPSGSLSSYALYVAPSSPAQRQADLWRQARPADAALMDRMAAQPVARWLNEWTGDVTTSVNSTLVAAGVAGRLAVFVAYNIPHRDCGSFSAGGAAKADAYRSWIRGFAAGMMGRRAVVVLEPDAIAGAGCLTATLQDERFALLSEAVDVLGAAGAMVYLDAGHPRWLTTETAATRLTRAGIARAQGFALNVSNFVTTGENVTYGNALSARLGGKRYVIDTSRNGLGPALDNAWCNPDGRALGELPSTAAAHALVDALLWIKVPGESDGSCNGGPAAGAWWGEYALGLAQRAWF